MSTAKVEAVSDNVADIHSPSTNVDPFLENRNEANVEPSDARGVPNDGAGLTGKRKKLDQVDERLPNDVPVAAPSDSLDVVKEADDIPLLNYGRLVGSLPRRWATNTAPSNDVDGNYDVVRQSGDETRLPGPFRYPATASTLGQYRRHLLLSIGFSNGDLYLVNPATGLDIASPSQLQICPQGGHASKSSEINVVTGISIDADGRSLAACQRNGNLCVWALKYRHDVFSNRRDTAPSTPEGGSVLSTEGSLVNSNAPEARGGMASPAGISKGDKSTGVTEVTQERGGISMEETKSQDILSQYGPKLMSPPIPMIRFSYGLSCIPTCLVIDPACSRKSDKRVAVGFADGRVVITKRGGFWNRRTDMTIYQSAFAYAGNVAGKSSNKGMKGSSSTDMGRIESLAWRGTVLAWADSSGVKLYDVDTSQRLAHIDRPNGARPSLYQPSVGTIKCNLCWESHKSLLLAWGDCVMAIEVRDITSNTSSSSSAKAAGAATAKIAEAIHMSGVAIRTGPGALASLFSASQSLPSGSSHGRLESTSSVSAGMGYGGGAMSRRIVECSMAWELDCVASGVAPLDSGHIAVLGIPLASLNSEEGGAGEGEDGRNGAHELSKGDQDAKTLQSAEAEDVIRTHSVIAELEIVHRNTGRVISSDRLQLVIPTGDENKSRPVHAAELTLLSSYSVARTENRIETEERIAASQEGELPSFTATAPDASGSVPELHQLWSMDKYLNKNLEGRSFKMDDLEEHIRQPRRLDQNTPEPIPPVMIISSPYDIVSSSVHSVDDAVNHARVRGDAELALLRGFLNRKHLRALKLEQLVHEFLFSLLYRNGLDGLQRVARCCPALLMGRCELWEKWIYVFAKVPGGLFALRSYIPVRDPRLPSAIYDFVVNKMFLDIESLVTASPYSEVVWQASQFFFAALRFWGPTSGIESYIALLNRPHSTISGRQWKGNVGRIKSLESALEQRFFQSAAQVCTESNILRTITKGGPDHDSIESRRPVGRRQVPSHSSLHALYSMVNVASRLAQRLEIKRPVQESSRQMIDDFTAHLVVEALAELSLLRGHYADSLRFYLLLGTMGKDESDDEALSYVFNANQHGTSGLSEPEADEHPYQHVLSLIEKFRLHHHLVDGNFVSVLQKGFGVGEEHETEPLVALINLLGLDLVGRFLVETCYVSLTIGAETTFALENSFVEAERASSIANFLSIDAIASQLKGRPKFLLWVLHLLFCYRPDLYINFSNVTVPPKEVLDLHRLHFELLVKYSSGRESFSRARTLQSRSSVLLDFLKAALPLGGVGTEYARQALEERRKELTSPLNKRSLMSPFALELAYVLESSGDLSEDDSKSVLMLYLVGAQSVIAAVQFAESNKEHQMRLWETLIAYCLKIDTDKKPGKLKALGADTASSFGELLQAAAQYGADLAHLVNQIPQGMRIKGLRPMLVSAVADYRLRLEMHESISDACNKDKVALLRLLAHRSMRASRIQYLRGCYEDLGPILSLKSTEGSDNSILDYRAQRKSRAFSSRQYRLRRSVALHPKV